MTRRGPGFSEFLLLFLISNPAVLRAADDGDSPGYWQPAQQALAKLGDGFLVWETHRTGRWSIWTCRLDGLGAKQLSVEAADKDQVGPKISPDGKRVVYLSFPKAPPAEDGCPAPQGQQVPLRIVNTDGTGDRALVPDARPYSGWQRCVTWFNDHELAYISGADGNTYQLDVESGKSALLIKRDGRDGPSWLPNSLKTYAVWSFGTFSPFDAKLQTVKPLPHMGGCQCYFTQDGEWGFWEAYCGGPIGVAHLESWVLAGDRTLVTHSLERAMMPSKHRDYVYFAMYSADRRLLAFAAKDHDAPGGYGKADWEIFVVPTDPTNLSVIGPPVRYTFDPECDRFPDVWQTPLPLGFQSAKAPFNAAFAAPGAGGAWDFGDGAKGTGAKASHAYTKPGLYTVTMMASGKPALVGQVLVVEAKPPVARRAILKGTRELVVVFSEPVNLDQVTVKLKSGIKIEKAVPGEHGWALHLALAEQPKSGDLLLIDGVTDLAQQPNRMAPAELAFDVRVWPSTREGLVFLWQGGDKPNLLRDPAKGDLSCVVTAKGRAWYNHDRDLVIDGGAFAIQGVSEVFAKAIQKSKAFTIEISLVSAQGFGGQSPAVLSYGLHMAPNEQLLLRQQDRELVLPTRFGLLKEGVRANSGYLAITFANGRLLAFNGVNMSFNAGAEGQFVVEKIADTDKFPIDLATFANAPLLIGNNAQSQGWEGGGDRSELGLTVRSLAFYDRALSAEELSANFKGRCAIELARPAVERFNTSGGAVAESKVPQPAEIAPYTRALAVNEYDVPDPAAEGKRRRIRVAHWVLFDGRFERIAQLGAKADINLINLEPFAANQQFEGEYLGDTLPPEPDLPLYFCPLTERCTRGGTFMFDVVGPFAVPAVKALDAPTDLEKNLANINKAYAPAPGQAWKALVNQRRLGDGYFDLNPQFPEAKGNCAYGHFYIQAPEARKALVAVETAGGAKVWLNGAVALSVKSDTAARVQKRAPVELKAGWNEIIIKAVKVGTSWGFVCDVLGADGREMGDVKFTTDLDKPPVNVW